ncbi:hypothetical protein GGI15_004857 [Coemansia interrupta]|uniref:Uncharacterized protein n=1 Tax=Coemansia interrupta TaxID=1126814 RepID=A0A9W8LEZ3_9FUNG|nr:hypothetical protein GGI15_004857 [Coemansia interrupta]
MQIVSYIRATQNSGLQPLNSRHLSISIIQPEALVWFAIVASGLSLLIGLTFAILDLVGMIVLRSRMWQHISRFSSGLDGMGEAKTPMWDMYGSSSNNSRTGEWWPPHMMGKGYEHGTVRWWQRWVVVEELVLWIQRNIALIRLTLTTGIALLWSSAIIQIVAIAVAGRCHVGAKDSSIEDSTEDVCVLLRHGMVGSIVSWACWNLVAVLLVFCNTRPQRIRSRMGPTHALAGFPLPMLDYGAGPNIAAGEKHSSGMLAAGHLMPMAATPTHLQGQQPSGQPTAHLQPHFPIPVPASASLPPLHAHAKASSNLIGAHRLNSSRSGGQRSSWSHYDAESIMTESRSDEQNSILDSKNHLMFQLYHLQNQQFQSLHQFQQPVGSRLSGEHATRQSGQQTVYRSAFSSVSSVSDHPGDHLVHSGEAGSDDLMRGFGGRLPAQQRTNAPLNQAREGGALAAECGAQSLAALGNMGGAGGAVKCHGKRRTIG